MIRIASAVRLSAVATLAVAGAYVTFRAPTPTEAEPSTKYMSPMDMVQTPDGATLYVSLHTGNGVAVVDAKTSKLKGTIPVPGAPSGVAISPDGAVLYVAQAHANTISLIETASRKVLKSVPVGWYPWGIAVGADGAVYVCNRDSHDVSVVDPKQGKEIKRFPASREPMYAAVAGGKLLVTNGLPTGPATDHTMAASVSIIDLKSGEAKQRRMTPGCNALRQIVVSPDGKYAYFVHLLSRFNVPTTQLDRGWMNTNALTVFDLEKDETWVTILLDEIMRGYANPWGLTMTDDGKQLYITHKGSDDVTVIEVARLHEYCGEKSDEDRYNLQNRLSTVRGKDVGDHFLCGGKGPRGIALAKSGGRLYVANYFSDTLTVIDVNRSRPRVMHTIELNPNVEMDEVRKGEMLFNDATICFQHWQSCTSCHPDTRADGFNWDLMNDDIGNPKNVKSLVWAHKTPPAMSLGIRESMEVAVVAGIRYIEFREPEPGEAEAIQAYLRWLEPRPSPHLVNGKLSAAAQRGKFIFESEEAGCSKCHPAPLYTDLKIYDVGTKGEYDREDSAFDTPTLVEGYRTGPYLHTGACATLREVITKNEGDKHGKTSHLQSKHVDDLVAYLESL